MYTIYIILSISARVGIEFAVPILVVDIPAKQLANLIASTIGLPSHKAVASAPLNASPAPDVSTTWFVKSNGGSKCLSFWLKKYAPFSPNVIKTFLTPRSKILCAYFFASSTVLISPSI